VGCIAKGRFRRHVMRIHSPEAVMAVCKSEMRRWWKMRWWKVEGKGRCFRLEFSIRSKNYPLLRASYKNLVAFFSTVEYFIPWIDDWSRFYGLRFFTSRVLGPLNLYPSYQNNSTIVSHFITVKFGLLAGI
jgi:hypothetical protein